MAVSFVLRLVSCHSFITAQYLWCQANDRFEKQKVHASRITNPHPITMTRSESEVGIGTYQLSTYIVQEESILSCTEHTITCL
eukprot:scaffold409_cov143-Skeletonema_menzelii.AAC.8